MLRAAKHLEAHGARPFAALRACPERSEWGDKKGPSHSTTCTLCSYAQPPSPSEILDLCLRLMHIGRPQGSLLLWTGLGCDFVAVGTLASPSVLFLMPHRTCPPWATQGSPPHIQTSPVPLSPVGILGQIVTFVGAGEVRSGVGTLASPMVGRWEAAGEQDAGAPTLLPCHPRPYEANPLPCSFHKIPTLESSRPAPTDERGRSFPSPQKTYL